MNVELETLPNCQATLKIEIAPERVARERERVINEFLSFAKLPGFRPGKAPRNVVAAKYKKDIEEELTKSLLSSTTREAIREKSLDVLSITNVEDIEFGPDQTLRYKATLLTAPIFELPDYKSITAPELSAEVTEQDIEAMLERMREQAADFNEITGRPLAMGDFAVIDYTGTIDGKPVDEFLERGGGALSGNKDFWLLMGEESFLPGFCPNLVGAELEGTKEFDVTLPADFPLEGLRDKVIHFAATLKSIRERILPEVNDEFAAKIAGDQTLDQLKAAIRTELGLSKAYEAEKAKRDGVVNTLLGMVDFELPDAMVRHEIRRILNDMVQDNQARGVSEEELRDNKQQLVAGATAGAKNRVKATFILVRIAEKEGIKVSETELNSRLVSMARRYEMTPEKLKKELLKNNAIDNVQEEILVGKVLDFLVTGGSVATKAVEVPEQTV